MAHYGLSSLEAQKRLHGQLHRLTGALMTPSWWRELRQPPHAPLVCLVTALASLLLIFDFSLGQQDTQILLQAIVLFLLACLNVSLFCWEVYIIKTRRVRRLLSKIKPFLDSPCPWNPHSYPQHSVNTLRGACTVHAYRDGLQVHLPTSLVVQGDVIELYRNVPSPAEATLLDDNSITTTTSLHLGETLPDELFIGRRKEESICFVQEELRHKLVVTQTPVIATFMNTMKKKRPASSLSREKKTVLFGLNITLLVTVTVSFLFNLIRFLALSDDSGSWSEMLIRSQVYTILPLLSLPLSFVWVLANLYGTARIVLLLEDPEHIPSRRSIAREMKEMWRTAKQMCTLAFCPSMYPNYRLFHILGSLTSLCSVDKEHVLTDSLPIPEKVYFLSCGGSPEDEQLILSGEEGERGSTYLQSGGEGEKLVQVNDVVRSSQSAEGGEGRGDNKQTGFLIVEGEQSLSSSRRESLGSHKAENDEKYLMKSATHGSDDFNNTREVNKDPSPDSDGEARMTATQCGLQLSPSRGLSKSTSSLAAPFELVSEILDLSPNYNTPSGICFDDVNWEDHLGSLKPIGVNALAASHILDDPYSWCPSGCTERVKKSLCKTNCICTLGNEIGVTDFSQASFTSEVLLYSISDTSQGEDTKFPASTHRASTSLLAEQEIQPHLVSSVLRDNMNQAHLIMSRGSGEMVAACCSDFWDGRDLQPMTDFERGEIAAFYARRHLSSYCVALAYNPLVDVNVTPLRKQKLGLYVPSALLHGHADDNSYAVSMNPIHSYSAEQVFNSLLCNQVFLGIVSLQFRPNQDIVLLIEELEMAGIRFVYFTNENEVQGKVFAEKLGLEAGWNCHISLAPPSEDENMERSHEDQHFSCSTSTSSSLNSVINAFQSYIRAKLPKGIKQVRPHLRSVDNVPLLVPLFTDCTTEAVREMIEIMQENGEVVMCIGNSWNQDNLSVFAQADVSLSITPDSTSLHNCPKSKGDLSSAACSDTYSGSSNLPNSQSPTLIWPTPLEMASYLNSTMCQLSCHRENDLSLLSLVTESRHIVSSIRHSLLFGLGSSLSLALLILTATLLFLPPPLSGGHIFWFLLFTIPLVTLSILSSARDERIKSQMPSRKKGGLAEQWLLLCHFSFTFVPTSLVCALLFALTLQGICFETSSTNNTNCHFLLGNRSDTSLWNGWRGEQEQGLSLAQDVVAFFFALYTVAHSIRFVHRTEPIWTLYRYVSWLYILSCSIVLLLQIVYFALSQCIATSVYNLPTVASLSTIPPHVLGVGFVWLFVLPVLHELLKYYDKRMFVGRQRHLKLAFETKLGMNSPF